MEERGGGGRESREAQEIMNIRKRATCCEGNKSGYFLLAVTSKNAYDQRVVTVVFFTSVHDNELPADRHE